MNTEGHRITVGGIHVAVVRKNIRNLHLGVYPPHGRVRVAVPLAVNDKAVRLAVVGKLGWIKRQQARFEAQPRQSRREMVTGESHYLFGRRYRLNVVEHAGPCEVNLRRKSFLDMHVRPGTGSTDRELLLREWYRRQLKDMVPQLLEKWQRALGLKAGDWRVRKMKTRWGSCNGTARRVWLNLELAKKPVQCIEYILVHELVHLVERSHGDRFTALMDKHLPRWRSCRKELNSAPLCHETWRY